MTIFEGAEPFFREGSAESSTACLLVHGFTASVHETRDLGSHLNAAGVTVEAILLPGHGTSPEALEKTGWEDWYSAVEEAYLKLQDRYRKVFVCGVSLGGALCLYLSANHKPHGVISISGGVVPGDPRMKWIGIGRHFVRFVRKSNGPDIRDAEARRRAVSYDTIPTRSIHELRKFLKVLRPRLKDVTAPVLLIHARQDHVMPIRNLDILFDAVSSADKQRLILEESYHVIPLDLERDTARKAVLEFVLSRA